MTYELKLFPGERTVSSLIPAETIRSTGAEVWKKDHYVTPHTKINSKWVKDVTPHPGTTKLLEENFGETLEKELARVNLILWPRQTLGGKYHRSTGKKSINQSINKWVTPNQRASGLQKKQPSEGSTDRMEGNIFSKYLTDKGLISGIYKELKELNNKKQTTHLKMGHFFKWWNTIVQQTHGKRDQDQ